MSHTLCAHVRLNRFLRLVPIKRFLPVFADLYDSLNIRALGTNPATASPGTPEPPAGDSNAAAGSIPTQGAAAGGVPPPVAGADATPSVQQIALTLAETQIKVRQLGFKLSG